MYGQLGPTVPFECCDIIGGHNFVQNIALDPKYIHFLNSRGFAEEAYQKLPTYQRISLITVYGKLTGSIHDVFIKCTHLIFCFLTSHI